MLHIDAIDLKDARRQLGLMRPRASIKITWRVDQLNFSKCDMHGCIVDATEFVGQDVPRSFDRNDDALDYITSLLRLHEVSVVQQQTEQGIAKLRSA